MSLSNKISLSLLVPVLLIPGTEKISTSFQNAKKKPVNVLFLLADDLRANTIHALGNNEIITPNLDRLTQNGTSFTRAYIMGGSQGAVSVPSRAMILTGKYLTSLVKTGSFIPDDHLMIGEYLQIKGYNSHGIGKWHNGIDSYARDFSSGGNIFFGGMTDQFNPLTWKFDSTGKYLRDSSKNQPFLNKSRNATELFADDAIKYLDNYKGEKPFFLYVAFTSPHDPRVMPPEYIQMYDTSKIMLPENFLPQHPFDNGELIVRDELLAGFPRTKAEIKIHIRDYYAMITHLDAQIGRIIKALKKSGQYDNTIIVFAGDNGLALGQHGLMGKQSVYEHSVGVPLVFSGKGIPKNKISNAFCYLTDIYPTLCTKLGLDIPVSVEGKSLVGCIDNNSEIIRDYLYFSYRDFQRAVRNGKYKLIEYNVEGKRNTQLFDLVADPWETINLSENKDYLILLNDLRQKMIEQKKLTKDNGSFWNGISFFNESK
jgi:arylsulfatase A-like enzyme